MTRWPFFSKHFSSPNLISPSRLSARFIILVPALHHFWSFLEFFIKQIIREIWEIPRFWYFASFSFIFRLILSHFVPFFVHFILQRDFRNEKIAEIYMRGQSRFLPGNICIKINIMRVLFFLTFNENFRF